MSRSSENDYERQMIFVMFYTIIIYTMFTLGLIILVLMVLPLGVFFWHLNTDNIWSRRVLFVSILLSVILWIFGITYDDSSSYESMILDAENVFEQHMNCLDRVNYDLVTNDDVTMFAYDLNNCDMNLIEDIERYYDRYY